LVVGLQNGRVVVTNFSNDIGQNSFVKEFVPKYTRACNDVAWNPSLTNMIAVGFDKLRSDFGALVWDIEYVAFSTPYTFHLIIGLIS
jgi:hypothetical protein